MKHSLVLFKRYGLSLSLGLLLVVTVLSLIPANHLPSVSSSDKLRHALAYCVIALPIVFLRPSRWYWMLAGVVVWSGLIELLQPYSGRYAEWLDLLANGIGVFLAFVIAQLVFMVYPPAAAER